MTEAELAAVIRGIAPIVREQIAQAVSDLAPRVALGELRDRMIVVETKVAAPAVKDLGDLPTRLAVVETQTAALEQRVRALEEAQAELADESGEHTAAFTKELGALRERAAVLETRAPVAGPPGLDGISGKDGADGLGFEDLGVDFDGERTLMVTFTRGATIKAFPIALPFLKYQGVYQDGARYVPGDVVTWAGSLWIVGEETSAKPGDGSKAYTLAVKKGRDGRDGQDAPGALPVVKVGGSR